MRKRILLVYAGFVLIGLPGGAFGVAWPSIAKDLDRSVSELGIVIVAFTVGFMATCIVFERVDRIVGRGPLLVMGSALTTAAMAGLGAAPAWLVLLTAAAAIGAGTGLMEGGINSYVAAHHGARLMSWAHAALAFGAVLGPLVMTAVTTLGGSWRGAFGIIAVAQGMLTVGLWTERARYPKDRAEPIEAAEAPTPPSRPESRRLLWAALIMFFAYTGVEVTAGQWSFTLFTEGRSIGDGTAGLIISAFYAVFMGGRIVVGAIGDRIPAERIVRLSMVASVGLSALYWWSPASWIGAAALVGLGAAYAAVFPMLMVLTPRHLGGAMAARAIGYQLAAAGFGVAAISGGAGLFVEVFGLESVGAILFFGAALLLAVSEVSTRSSEPSRHFS